MKKQKFFGIFSIRQKIFLGFLVIIMLFGVFSFGMYLEMTHVKDLADQVVPYSVTMRSLQEFSTFLEYLSRHIDEFFIVEFAEYVDYIHDDLSVLQRTLLDLEKDATPHLLLSLDELKILLLSMSRDIEFLIDTKQDLTAKKNINQTIARVYQSIKRSREISRVLLDGASDQIGVNVALQREKIVLIFSQMIFMGIIMFLVGVGLSWLIARTISYPLINLRNLTSKMARGDLDGDITHFSNDEVGQLAMSFNIMMKDLRETMVSRDLLIEEIDHRKKAEAALSLHMKKLDEINQELDDFTYIVSHDLKEPLRSIEAFSKFLDDDLKDMVTEDGRHYLDRIRANAARMRDLIDDLLEISRIERQHNPFEHVDSANLINDVLLRMEFSLKEKNVDLKIAQDLPAIFCDRVRIAEIFHNLISNAIKFCDKDRPVIEVGCAENDNEHIFHVKDNGPGIEDQYREQIFKIFQRLEKREDHEGTGAGLTIAQKIVNIHGGRIWVESVVGEGTTFCFTIPK